MTHRDPALGLQTLQTIRWVRGARTGLRHQLTGAVGTAVALVAEDQLRLRLLRLAQPGAGSCPTTGTRPRPRPETPLVWSLRTRSSTWGSRRRGQRGRGEGGHPHLVPRCGTCCAVAGARALGDVGERGGTRARGRAGAAARLPAWRPSMAPNGPGRSLRRGGDVCASYPFRTPQLGLFLRRGLAGGGKECKLCWRRVETLLDSL